MGVSITMPDYTDIDAIALQKFKRELPAVAFPERDSLLHFILKALGWKEEHSIDTVECQFVKMSNPERMV